MAEEMAFEALAEKAFDDDEHEHAQTINTDATSALINESKNAAILADLKKKHEGELDDDDDDDDDDDEPKDLATIAKKAVTEFVKVFVDYGPAYTDEP